MSKYTIIHGQLCELPEDELMHWKYIKREKVNGKWKYYYDLGETQKKAYEQAKNAYDTRKAQVQSAYKKNLPVAGGMKSDGNVAAARYYNSDSHHKSASYDKLKKNLDETKAAYDKTPLAKREARAEKTKQNVNKVKSWAKDKLGYDEKQAMETAKTKSTIAKNEALDVEAKNSKWKIKYTDFDPYTGEASGKPGYDKVEELADWQTNYYKELAKEAEDKYIDAIEEYKKTPLAKVEKMQKRIETAKDKFGFDEYERFKDVENRKKDAEARRDALKKLSDTLKNRYGAGDAGTMKAYNEYVKADKDCGDISREYNEIYGDFITTPYGHLYNLDFSKPTNSRNSINKRNKR